MDNWMILIFIVFFASLLQSSTGFGFSIVGTPFLLLIYPPQSAIQINIILSLCLSIIMIYKIKNEVNYPLLKKLVLGSLIGIVPGLLMYLFLNMDIFKVIVGVLIIILTILLFAKVTIRQTDKRDFAAGTMSGLLTTSIGVPGPPLLLYFSSTSMDKMTLRSTTLAYYLFIYLVSLIMQVSFGGSYLEVWTSSLIALIPLLAGIILGQLLFKRINQRVFRMITYVILLFTGLYMLVAS
ncbi:sulfite exporter TauE/SafE family protein [Chengkuizengella sediminis]|uniref:sulfite exporter TauE/SafE family protein n=1 Tax=Chengkuizengella sediminis TaxID=1885917 RepID=UPI00138A4C0D|nr:sulfite exporter TauE/SafE family protein [Chengkuizengella sediminis]NDI35298.1 sulfite exporter TauE/SafE family protein [Chengkuizengella sediminis]